METVGGMSVSINHGDGRRIELETASAVGLEISYSVDYSLLGGASEFLDLKLDEEAFRREIARARTFAITGHDRQTLAGLDGPALWTSSGLTERRFPNEFVRHKILDLIGDLMLLGAAVEGRITIVRGGHALHHELATAIGKRPVRTVLS